MDFLWSLWINTVEKILEAALILVIREINQLLKLFFESVTQEAIVNSSHARHVDSNNPEMLHLLSRKTGTDQVHTGAEPSIQWASFLETDISTSFQLSHKTVDILLRHLVNFPTKALIDCIKIFDILIFVIHMALNQCFLALNFRN